MGDNIRSDRMQEKDSDLTKTANKDKLQLVCRARTAFAGDQELIYNLIYINKKWGEDL